MNRRTLLKSFLAGFAALCVRPLQAMGIASKPLEDGEYVLEWEADKFDERLLTSMQHVNGSPWRGCPAGTVMVRTWHVGAPVNGKRHIDCRVIVKHDGHDIRIAEPAGSTWTFEQPRVDFDFIPANATIRRDWDTPAPAPYVRSVKPFRIPQE